MFLIFLHILFCDRFLFLASFTVSFRKIEILISLWYLLFLIKLLWYVYQCYMSFGAPCYICWNDCTNLYSTRIVSSDVSFNPALSNPMWANNNVRNVSFRLEKLWWSVKTLVLKSWDVPNWKGLKFMHTIFSMVVNLNKRCNFQFTWILMKTFPSVFASLRSSAISNAHLNLSSSSS